MPFPSRQVPALSLAIPLAVSLTIAVAIAGAPGPLYAQSWVLQNSTTTASLRGISAIDPQVAWASGSTGTFLRTTDGGQHWQASIIPGAASLDFRGVCARSASSAWLLSSGPGNASRIFRTTDSGHSWKPLFTNPDPQGFFDGIAFWDATHGIVMGDPISGPKSDPASRFVIFITSDAGSTWTRQPGPVALPSEGAFAASNSALIVAGSAEVWFASGGIGAARIFHSLDRGRTWTAAATSPRSATAGAGIFSLAALPHDFLVAVGGDYALPNAAAHNLVISTDRGATWPGFPSATRSSPRGYRSAVAWLPHSQLLLTTGPSGSEFSRNHGHTWTPFDNGAFNALTVGSHDACWAVGPKGRIAKLLRN